MAGRRRSVDPAKRPADMFTLYSIPAYEAGEPERLTGSEIGSTKQALEAGDVLLSRIVPHIRRAWIVEPLNGEQTIGSSEWVVFRGSDVEPSYLRHFLLSEGFHRQLMCTVVGVGGSLLRARPELVAKIQIPLPARDEQRRIARILDAADAVRSKRHQCLLSLDGLVRTIYAALFQGEWPRFPLGDVLDRIDSGNSPVCDSRPARGDEWGVLKLGAISFGRYDARKNKALLPGAVPRPGDEVHVGDILLARKNTRELVGASVLVRDTPDRLLLPDLMFRLVLAEDAPLDAAYLQAALDHPRNRAALARLAGGSAGSMPNISKARLRSVEVDVPPLERQQSYAERTRQVELIRERMRAHLRHLDALFGSLQSRAFAGEL